MGPVQVIGDPEDEGFVYSFFTGKVLCVCEEGRRYEVVYDEVS